MSSNPNGTFLWREIMTPDVAASKRFYGEVFGWKFEDMPMEGFTYTMIKNGEKGIGGMSTLDASTGAPPHWISTVCVDDIDARANTATASGGKVLMPPGDIPGYGRFAVIADAQGAPITLMCPTGEGNPSGGMPGLGEFCWEHLNTTDVAGAKAFYAKVLGWEVKDSAAGMEVFKAGEAMVASFATNPEGVPAHWLTYVVVDDLAAARGRAVNNGAKVLLEEHGIPTIGSFSIVIDNVGATICFFKSLT